jgi:hydrogenase nickel incorporation protein HypA/HybF
MHELSIALSVVEMAEEEAERRGVRVEAVHVRLGLLSGVVKEALLSAYEIAREGGPLAEASLVIEEVAVLAHCPACQAARAVRSVQQLCCAVCGSPTSEVIQGRELEVVALEVQ